MRRILLILTVCVMLGLAGCAANNLGDDLTDRLENEFL